MKRKNSAGLMCMPTRATVEGNHLFRALHLDAARLLAEGVPGDHDTPVRPLCHAAAEESKGGEQGQWESKQRENPAEGVSRAVSTREWILSAAGLKIFPIVLRVAVGVPV